MMGLCRAYDVIRGLHGRWRGIVIIGLYDIGVISLYDDVII